MRSVIEEIQRFRNQSVLDIDTTNINRYRLVVNEQDKTKTAYYFAVPIYERMSRKLVDIRFKKEQNGIRLTGSSSDITMSDDMLIENEQGTCRIEFPNGFAFYNDGKALCGNGEVFPTVNGIMFKVEAREPFKFVIRTSRPFNENICNGKCFCLMSEKFRPSLTVSCIGVSDNDGYIIAPAKIAHKMVSPTEYELTVGSETVSEKGSIVFEINSYENKLFQDTTVESRNPDRNNAFGGTAFVGHTQEFGEQWLYSRLMYNAIYDCVNHKINKAVLHFPKFSKADKELSIFTVQYRFCSFGSTWNNKKATHGKVADTTAQKGYLSADITDTVASQPFGEAIWTKGMIIKPKANDEEFIAISTGDSSYAPVIFEINYI